MKRTLLLGLCSWVLAGPAFAHGLLISNVRYETVDAGASEGSSCESCGDHGPWITFDVSWRDSWRGELNPTGSDAHGIESWDAVWLFVKYRLNSQGRWRHATIQPSGPQPSGFVLEGTRDRLGAFIYQKKTPGCLLTGRGHSECWRDVDFRNVTVRWLPPEGQDPTGKNVDLWIHGIEMVYVPEGSYRVGESGCSGTGSAVRDARCFFRSDDPVRSLVVESEDALSVCDEQKAGICHRLAGGGLAPSTVLPAEFPKGFQAFYAMKYELDQGQYADFVNSLPTSARTLRFSHGAQQSYRYAVSWVRYGSEPIRVARRPDRACNWVSWADTAAYLDWAALRPMSELELEKLARGPGEPVAGAYAWGSTWLAPAQVIVGSEEQGITVNGNCNIGDHHFVGGDGGHGPLPGHAFIYTTSNFIETISPPSRRSFDAHGAPAAMSPTVREHEGRSYYGAMHLSGNLWEFVVGIGPDEGRAFEGGHGDGELEFVDCTRDRQDCGAHANVPDWPKGDGRGVGFRGGAWYTPQERGRVVDRHFMDFIYQDRSHDTGIRGARTAHGVGSPE